MQADIYLPPTEEISAPSIPHSREAEEAVCGSVLINPETYYELSAFLKDTDFYIHRNRWIWNAFVTLKASNREIDLLTVAEELDRQNRLIEIGGPAYLTSLVNQVPNSLNAESYGRIVRDHAIRRRMINAANQIAVYSYDKSKDIEVIGSDSKRLLEEAVGIDQGEKNISISELASSHYEMVEKNSTNPVSISGIQTGLIDLDLLLDGLQNAVSYCVAGRPKQGKTSLVMQLALASCGALSSLTEFSHIKQKKNTLVFSRESPKKEIVNRMLSLLAGIDGQLLKKGRLEEAQWPLYTFAVESLSSSPISIYGPNECSSIEKVYGICRSRANHGELNLVVADYLQLFNTTKRYSSREQEVSAISRTFAKIAGDFNVPVVFACQMNRAIEARSDHYPVLADLRESGSIEQDAGAIMFLHHNSETKIILAAHRHGR